MMYSKTKCLVVTVLAAWTTADAAFMAGAPRPYLLVRQQQQRELDPVSLLAAAPNKDDINKKWEEEHLIHGAKEIHEETDEELREAEQAAAVDASDVSDAGMEAAMEERAVMLANELAHKLKKDAEE